MNRDDNFNLNLEFLSPFIKKKRFINRNKRRVRDKKYLCNQRGAADKDHMSPSQSHFYTFILLYLLKVLIYSYNFRLFIFFKFI